MQLPAATARPGVIAAQPLPLSVGRDYRASGGADYLDPQLLSRVSGVQCRNLDLLLCGEEWVSFCGANSNLCPGGRGHGAL